jgi:hypothetical protein
MYGHFLKPTVCFRQECDVSCPSLGKGKVLRRTGHEDPEGCRGIDLYRDPVTIV